MQVPQYYVNDIETGHPCQVVAQIDQRLFYKRIQPSKSLNNGSFSCGSNEIAALDDKRAPAHLTHNEPAGKKATEPGGWSDRLTGKELFRQDVHERQRPVISFQTPMSPTEDHATTVMLTDKTPEAPKGRRMVFQDDILAKGESPKDPGNLISKQQIKWAGGTIGDFFYLILPRFLRAIPLLPTLSFMYLSLVNSAPGTFVISALERADKTLSKLPVISGLWESDYNIFRTLPKYFSALAWEVALPNAPKMNPLSKVGREFFRSGGWYFRGERDLTLLTSPLLLTSAVFGSALLGRIISPVFTPIAANPVVFLAFFFTYLSTTLGSYLYACHRMGQKVTDVLFKKEAVFLGLAWPAYLHADFWGVRGPSGRLGATTTKGVGGFEPLALNHTVKALAVGIGSLVNAGIGIWLIGNSIYFLGAATAFSGPGIGLGICTFWALYHAIMIFRGFQVSHAKAK